MAYIGNSSPSRFVSNRTKTAFSGNGILTDFTLEQAVVQPEDVLVSVDGVIQEPTVAYGIVSGTTLRFTEAPSSNAGNNIFVYYLASQVGTAGPPNNSVSTTTLKNNAVDLTSKVTGVLPIANGGIGATSYVFVYAQGTDGYVTGSTNDFLPLNAVYQHKGTGNSDYNTSTYKYTAPVNGIYQISMSVIVSATDVSTHYELNVDGTNVYVYSWSAGGRDSDGSTSIYLDAGQVVGFRNGNNAGYYRHSASLPSSDHYTVASFCLLREL